MLAVRDQITRPLFIESDRLAMFKPRGIDVNVVLDLMIHDIDLILSFARSEITAVRASGFPVLTAGGGHRQRARIEFADGCVADVSASRVSQTSLRKLRIFQPDQYFSIDCENFHSYRSVRKEGSGLGPAACRRSPRRSQQFQKADPLMAEIRAFAHACARAPIPGHGARRQARAGGGAGGMPPDEPHPGRRYARDRRDGAGRNLLDRLDHFEHPLSTPRQPCHSHARPQGRVRPVRARAHPVAQAVLQSTQFILGPTGCRPWSGSGGTTAGVATPWA